MSTTEFDNKFESLTPSLNAFAYNLTKNTEDAKDLYQETAFRTKTKRDKFKQGTNQKACLITIMKNTLINNYRKKKKKNTIVDTTENLFYINSGGAMVDNDAGRNILIDELESMIDKLDESTKTPFMMHFTGYKYQEIADALELPLGTVKSRIFFARKELKDNIMKHYGDFNLVRERIAAV